MTKQEIFDTIWQWFIVDKNPQSIVDGVDSLGLPTKSCRYRGPNGEKCAAGVLIYDDEYTPEMEGKNVNGVLHMKGTLIDRLSNHYRLMGALQSTHDLIRCGDFHERMEHAMRKIANIYNLSIPGEQQQ